MTVELVIKEKVCWRCGGARRINHDQDLCPGCQGTGLQGHLRPARAEGYLAATREIIGQTASTGADWTADDCPGYLVRQIVTVTGPEGKRLVYDSERDGWPARPQVPATFLPRADQPCPSCGGSGYRMYQREVPDGSGRIETVTEPCSGCGGRGRVG